MRRFFFIFLMLGFAAACGELNRQYGDGGLDEGVSPSESPGSIPIFPHPEDWQALHGAWVGVNGYGDCFKCHTKEQSTRPESPPGCFDCHDSYPHPATMTWRLFEGHGQVARSRGVEGCKSCHGSDLMTLKGGRNCYSCHASFPHTDNWLAPAGARQPHAVYVYDNSVEECGGCHQLPGSDEPSRNAGCASCHTFPYPHPAGWARPVGEPQLHGAEVNANSSASCARSTCHGPGLVPLAGVTRGPNCATGGCHGPVYPHAANIAQGIVHGPPALLNIAMCKDCHGNELDRAPAGFRNCTTCHPSATLHDFAEIGPDDWVVNHDDVMRSSSYNWNVEECRLCHGNNLAGGLSGESCFNCHEHIGGFPEGWVGEGRETEHAINFIGQMMLGDVSTCEACHGTNYDQPVGAEGIRCTTCHTEGVTHRTVGGVAWNTLGGHGLYFSSNFVSSDEGARCWDCHGTPVDFREVQDPGLLLPPVDTPEEREAEKNYLANQSNCYQCHFNYPHVGWQAGATVWEWEPVIPNTCGARDVTNFAHVLYVMGSPLVTDADGNRPSFTAPLEVWRATLENTCGGEAGSCHFDGNRSYRTGGTSAMCTGYCHSASRPWPLELPDCSPPPEALVSDFPPTVSSITPADGAAGVAVIDISPAFRTLVVVNFSEPMDRPSITTSGTFVLRKVSTGALVDGRFSCNSSPGWCQRATFTPTSQLEFGTLYEATITTAARDWGGTPMAADYSWSFTTAVPDITPPIVVSTTPAGGATGLPVTTRTFEATFNERLIPSSVSERDHASNLLCDIGWARFCIKRTVAIVCPVGQPACNGVAGTIACHPSTSNCVTVRFTANPTVPNLAFSTGYTVTVKEYRDISGNMMDPFSWSFTTEEEPWDE